MVRPESDSIQGIVDIDTFGYWVVGYISDLQPRSSRPLMSGYPRVAYIKDCPWDEMPDSLKGVLGKNYPSAQLPGWKMVNVLVSTGQLLFSLTSEFVVHDTDATSGKSTRGVMLDLYPKEILPEGERDNSTRGKFVLYRTGDAEILDYAKAVFSERMEEDAKDELAERVRLTSQTDIIPASLQDLRDIASLLEKFRDKATIA